ncbi:TPA: T9SS type A sorting domain-containing protein [Candidatus Poribacteria bacterium]|nr:T9SS type A sorting domain-containing protein [Candidatus Poribacteria bacterium]
MMILRAVKYAFISAFLIVFSSVGFSQDIGDLPNVKHTEQEAIDNGSLSFKELFDIGGKLFTLDFSTLDGYGRPNVNANGILNELAGRVLGDKPNDLFTRTFGPDASSCVECHNKPFAGGAGGNVANVFIRSWDSRHPFSVKEGHSNERNTKHVFGSGGLELLAEEMTAKLQATKSQAIIQAARTGQFVRRPLKAKGVNFGSLVAMPDGVVDTSDVVGVSADLIIKPFGSKGTIESIRKFTTNPLVHHHGIQADERLEDDPKKEIHPFHQWDDGDGYDHEATRGDVTALVIWQAAQPVPVQIIPDNPVVAQAVAEGTKAFEEIGCATCHIPQLIVDDPIFREPSRIDPTKSFSFDITRDGPEPHFERTADGKAVVYAYTDLKRHYMGEGLREPLDELGVDAAVFMTAELWGVGNTGPWMFNGRAFTLDRAIRMHGGEAQASRDEYAALPDQKQRELVEFLKSLVLPPNFQADIQLEKGLNMVSLPLKPYSPFSASHLAQKLGTSIVIRFNSQIQQFEGFTVSDPPPGFAVEGGKAYVVNAMQPATITITGDAWHRGEPNVRPFMRAPSATKEQTKWAFILCGKLKDADLSQKYIVSARNQRTGMRTADIVSSKKNAFSIVWVGYANQSIIARQDILKITVEDESNQRVIGELEHSIDDHEFDQAYVYLELGLEDVMPLQTVLAQNYPNPFNPETWIPYKLSESGTVEIQIYDARGKIVRKLDLGMKPTGIYFDQAYAAYWDGTNTVGEQVASGTYFYTFTTGTFSQTKKLVIAR